MNDNETYGVQLDLLTQNYNKKLQDVVNTTQTQAKLIEQKAKVNFGGYSPFNSAKMFAMDLQTDEIKEYQTQVQNILSDLKMGKIDTTQAKNSINDLLNDIKLTNDAFQNYTNTRIKINVDANELALLQQAGVNTQLIDKYVQVTNQDLSKTEDNANKLENNLGKAADEANRLNKNTNNTNRNTSELGQNFEKSMNKGVSSTRRLLFSLFSVHSVWSLISRASNTAITQNDAINSRVNVLNSALGNMMLPIVQKIVGFIEYGVIFGAKVIQFFTGFNALANLTTSNLKNSVKQAKELTKTLAGFDEITNIGGSSKGSLAGGIKNDMKALDDFYKKIEEVEAWMNKSGTYGFLGKVKDGFNLIWKAVQPLWDYALKPMFDFCIAHPEVLTAVFSIFLGNKLKNEIANIIGGSGTGLIGVHGILGKLAAIGIIGISIKIIYESVKSAKNAIEETNEVIQNMAEETEKSKEANKKWKDSLLDMNNESIIFKNLLKGQNSELKLKTDIIDGLIGNLDNMSNTEKILGIWLQGNNSQYHINNQKIKENSEKIKDNISYIDKLIKSNQLNNQESEYFIKNIQETIKKMEEQKTHLGKNSEGYLGLQSAIDFAKNTLNNYTTAIEQAKMAVESEIKKLEEENSVLATNSEKYLENQKRIEDLKNQADKLAQGDYTTSIEINTNLGVVDTTKEKIDNFTNTNYTCSIKVDGNTSPLKKTLLNTIKNIGSSVWNTLFPGLSFSSLLSKINSFDVGTNYVPNDQLAMVHKGEMIVPAKYNPMTSNIGGGHDEAIIEAIYELKDALENKDMNAYISRDAIGEAASDYKRERSRQLGRNLD